MTVLAPSGRGRSGTGGPGSLAEEREDQLPAVRVRGGAGSRCRGLGRDRAAAPEAPAELGYAVAPERRGRGIAAAVVGELVVRARAAGVSLVVARTLTEESASTTVLRRRGFARAGDAVVGGTTVWRWELPLARTGG